METIFEAGIPLSTDPAGTLDLLKRLGVSRVKVFLAWNSVAPTPTARKAPRFEATNPAAYPARVWNQYDAIIRAAKARGVAIDMTLGAPPLWAAGPGAPAPGPYPQWKPSSSEFGAFVRAVGTRYSGAYKPAGATSPLPRVGFWAIWNEPNYGIDLAPQAVNQVEVAPALYRQLLDAAWQALHQTGHGRDTILFGETAPRGQTVGNHPGNFDGMVPLRFLRALYCVDAGFTRLEGAAAAARACPTTAAASASFRSAHPALFEATAFAAHPYPEGGLPPNQVIPGEPDYADLASLPSLERTLDRLQRTYGSSRKLPIYSTEFGYQTNPPERIARTTPPSIAAVYLNWSEYISWKDPRIASYDQFLIQDPPAGNFATGIEFADGRHKATYPAFRLPLFLPKTTVHKNESVEVWGGVRPARFAGLPQQARLEFAGPGAPFHVIRTITVSDRDGYFDVTQKFSASGRVRLAWSYPHGPTVSSRAVDLTVR
jgi:hypothetical protein